MPHTLHVDTSQLVKRRYDAKFRSSQAFYFTVQSGFSIGFGVQGVMANDAANPEAARWYVL